MILFSLPALLNCHAQCSGHLNGLVCELVSATLPLMCAMPMHPNC
jgi:hypothetical protein